MAVFSLCKIEGCCKQAAVRGWCNGHYHRWQRHGDPLGGAKALAPRGEPQKFIHETVLTYEGDDCLTWPFSKRGGKSAVKFEGRMVTVSRLVCQIVNGSPPTPQHQAAHSCGKGHEGCVTKRHLSWKTPKMNNADKIAHDTRQNGERHGLAKLTEQIVAQIREEPGSLREIAAKYGVCRSTIANIRHGRTWVKPG